MTDKTINCPLCGKPLSGQDGFDLFKCMNGNCLLAGGAPAPHAAWLRAGNKWVATTPADLPKDSETVDVVLESGERLINCVYWDETDDSYAGFELMDLDGYQTGYVPSTEVVFWRYPDVPEGLWT